MIERQPYLPRFMAGGPGNPMGARAMYLGGTVYRIHGTNQPDTIGHAVSSGCFRLVNNDVADLYERVPVGTKVVVRQQASLEPVMAAGRSRRLHASRFPADGAACATARQPQSGVVMPHLAAWISTPFAAASPSRSPPLARLSPTALAATAQTLKR